MEVRFQESPGQNRTENKNAETQNVNFFSADSVSQFSPNRHENRIGQNISRGNPAGGRNGNAEIADDFRQGQINNRLVQPAQKCADNDGQQYPPAQI